MSDEPEKTDEEVMRGVLKGLYGSSPSVTVETRRSRQGRPRPVVEVEAKPIPLSEGGDDSFVVTFTAVLPDGKRLRLQSVRSPVTVDHKTIIRDYETEGREVRWIGKRPEEHEDE